MEVLDLLRAAHLKLTTSDDTLLVSPKSALTEELRELIRANKSELLQELEDEAAYERGLILLAELLAAEMFIPEPTVSSLRKYFPPLTGALPGGMDEEKAAEWLEHIAYYRELVAQFGRTGAAPRPLLNAVEAWERLECRQARDIPVPRAPWYQAAIAEWERIRDASRASRPKRRARQSKSSLPAPSPAPRVDYSQLWAPPDPALTNHGLAVEPEYLHQRLQDPAYTQRYAERLGDPVEAETVKMPYAPEVPTPASIAA